MKKIIYHGSCNIVKTPTYGYGKAYNDYGKGFYCTENKELAKEWGVTDKTNGYANCYEIECNNLKILNLNDKKYSVLNWLSILLENRSFELRSPLAQEGKSYILNNFMIDYKQYDIIIGYRADDSYFSFSQDFLNGAISYRQLNNAMLLGKLGEQFVLKSKKAFDVIKFKNYEIATKEQWYAQKQNRDKSARNEYLNLERNKRVKGDIYITKILDEEMKNNDFL